MTGQCLRRATAADLDVLLTLVAEFYEVDGHVFVDEVVRRALGPLLGGDEVGVVWMILDRGSVAGYAVVTWGYSVESGGRDALLDEIYVRERRRGVGGAALAAILDDCRARGLPRVFLETEAPNDAVRRFYARHGFRAEDSVWMSVDLAATGAPGASGPREHVPGPER